MYCLQRKFQIKPAVILGENRRQRYAYENENGQIRMSRTPASCIRYFGTTIYAQNQSTCKVFRVKHDKQRCTE